MSNWASLKNQISSINTLVIKDLKLEIRQQFSLYGVLLYSISSIFVVYILLNEPEGKVWNALFWLTQLFITVNAVAKSFIGESKARMLYYFLQVSPSTYIASKLIFNVLLMVVLNAVSVLLFHFLLNSTPINLGLFCLLSVTGGIGFSLIFTFLSAIAAKANQPAALITIMGFPLIIPQLMLLLKLTVVAFEPVIQAGFYTMLGLLFAFDAMIVVLALILFAYLWKD